MRLFSNLLSLKPPSIFTRNIKHFCEHKGHLRVFGTMRLTGDNSVLLPLVFRMILLIWFFLQKFATFFASFSEARLKIVTISNSIEYSVSSLSKYLQQFQQILLTGTNVRSDNLSLKQRL